MPGNSNTAAPPSNHIIAHTMDHLRNMTNMPNSELDYEIGRSKQCILNHGIPTTTFAYPFDNGKDNETIVNKVSQYYSYARSGNYPLMFFNCDHFRENTQQHDCRTHLPSGKISFANRYSIVGWSHDYDRMAYFYNDKQMLNRFIQVVSGTLLQPCVVLVPKVHHRVDTKLLPLLKRCAQMLVSLKPYSSVNPHLLMQSAAALKQDLGHLQSVRNLTKSAHNSSGSG
jgi:hypothetical protein